MARITLTCKSFRVRHEAEHIVIEIEDAQPANLVPQLMSKRDVAERLRVSVRMVEKLAKSEELPIVRIGGAVRFKETDVLRLQTENQGLRPRVFIRPLK